MKNKKILIPLISVLSLSSCISNESPQQYYFIGEVYDYETCSFLLEIDDENERLIYSFIVKKNGATDYFSFVFSSSDNSIWIRDMNEINDNFDFFYQSGEKLVFNEEHYVVLDTSNVIYISYENANEEIKNVIKRKDFRVSIGGLTYVNNPFL